MELDLSKYHAFRQSDLLSSKRLWSTDLTMKEGWMLKRSKNMHKWRKRWMRLTTDTTNNCSYLSSFKSERGYLQKRQATETCVISSMSFVQIRVDSTGTQSVKGEFSLKSCGDHSFHFRCIDDEQRHEWLLLLNRVIDSHYIIPLEHRDYFPRALPDHSEEVLRGIKKYKDLTFDSLFSANLRGGSFEIAFTTIGSTVHFTSAGPVPRGSLLSASPSAAGGLSARLGGSPAASPHLKSPLSTGTRSRGSSRDIFSTNVEFAAEYEAQRLKVLKKRGEMSWLDCIHFFRKELIFNFQWQSVLVSEDAIQALIEQRRRVEALTRYSQAREVGSSRETAEEDGSSCDRSVTVDDAPLDEDDGHDHSLESSQDTLKETRSEEVTRPKDESEVEMKTFRSVTKSDGRFRVSKKRRSSKKFSGMGAVRAQAQARSKSKSPMARSLGVEMDRLSVGRPSRSKQSKSGGSSAPRRRASLTRAKRSLDRRPMPLTPATPPPSRPVPLPPSGTSVASEDGGSLYESSNQLSHSPVVVPPPKIRRDAAPVRTAVRGGSQRRKLSAARREMIKITARKSMTDKKMPSRPLPSLVGSSSTADDMTSESESSSSSNSGSFSDASDSSSSSTSESGSGYHSSGPKPLRIGITRRGSSRASSRRSSAGSSVSSVSSRRSKKKRKRRRKKSGDGSKGKVKGSEKSGEQVKAPPKKGKRKKGVSSSSKKKKMLTTRSVDLTREIDMDSLTTGLNIDFCRRTGLRNIERLVLSELRELGSSASRDSGRIGHSSNTVLRPEDMKTIAVMACSPHSLLRSLSIRDCQLTDAHVRFFCESCITRLTQYIGYSNRSVKLEKLLFEDNIDLTEFSMQAVCDLMSVGYMSGIAAANFPMHYQHSRYICFETGAIVSHTISERAFYKDHYHYDDYYDDDFDPHPPSHPSSSAHPLTHGYGFSTPTPVIGSGSSGTIITFESSQSTYTVGLNDTRSAIGSPRGGTASARMARSASQATRQHLPTVPLKVIGSSSSKTSAQVPSLVGSSSSGASATKSGGASTTKGAPKLSSHSSGGHFFSRRKSRSKSKSRPHLKSVSSSGITIGGGGTAKTTKLLDVDHKSDDEEQFSDERDYDSAEMPGGSTKLTSRSSGRLKKLSTAMSVKSEGHSTGKVKKKRRRSLFAKFRSTTADPGTISPPSSGYDAAMSSKSGTFGGTSADSSSVFAIGDKASSYDDSKQGVRGYGGKTGFPFIKDRPTLAIKSLCFKGTSLDDQSCSILDKFLRKYRGFHTVCSLDLRDCYRISAVGTSVLENMAAGRSRSALTKDARSFVTICTDLTMLDEDFEPSPVDMIVYLDDPSTTTRSRLSSSAKPSKK